MAGGDACKGAGNFLALLSSTVREYSNNLANGSKSLIDTHNDTIQNKKKNKLLQQQFFFVGMNVSWQQQDFGPDGIYLYTFVVPNNEFEVSITNYGACITRIRTLDKSHQLGDVCIGHDNYEGYVKQNRYFGCIAGRVCNRIAGGRFFLNDRQVQLALNNNNQHCLHGGNVGFDKKVWKREETPNAAELCLRYVSPDGEENFPGTVDVRVTYDVMEIHEEDEEGKKKKQFVLRLRYDVSRGRDDTQDTIVNLTNHAYFNLDRSHGALDVLEHQMQIFSSHFTPADATLIPTGEERETRDTPMDFVSGPRTIGERIDDASYDVLQWARGYDHLFIVDSNRERWDKKTSSSLGQYDYRQPAQRAVVVTAPRSGRKLEVYTTEPGVQFYSGNFLDGTLVARDGPCGKRSGFCLETQHFSDSPNKPNFPSIVLRPKETYHSETQFRFGLI